MDPATDPTDLRGGVRLKVRADASDTHRAPPGVARKAPMPIYSDPLSTDHPERPDLAAVLEAAIGASVERQLLAHTHRTTEVDVEVRSNQEQLTLGLARLAARVDEYVTMMAGRLDTTEHGLTDRMLAMEARVNEQNGNRIAHLEATLGRIGSGFDDVIAALSQRIVELDNRFAELDSRVAEIDERFDRVHGLLGTTGPAAVEAVKEQLTSVVGEAMLVRIEMDRLTTSVDDKLDRATVRMAEIEARLTDNIDLESAVQLERLEEIERAVAELDPDTIVRLPRRLPADEGCGVGTSW